MFAAAAEAAAVTPRANDQMWQAVPVAPTDRDGEVAVIDKDGEHSIVFPCRRTGDGWIDAASGRHVDIRPTHWRLWAPHRRDLVQ